MFELMEKDKVDCYKSTWNSYLDSLKQNKGVEMTGMVIVPLVSCIISMQRGTLF